MKLCWHLISIMALLFSFPALAAKPRIVTSIKPLYLLVREIVEPEVQIDVLVGAGQSPHTVQLKPSQVKGLQEADIIFFIDPQFERFLENGLSILPEHVQVVALAKQLNLDLLNYRTGVAWEADKHEHSQGRHDDRETDNLHVWLDPEYAIAMVKVIADRVSVRWPEQATFYQRNAAKAIESIQRKQIQIKQQLEPVKNRSFVVFHDAYHYFEKRFQLNAVGSITLEAGQVPSMKRMSQIRQLVREVKPVCVFSEPQFSDKLIQTVIEDASIKRGTLDPLGSTLTSEHQTYVDLLQQMADNVEACLK